MRRTCDTLINHGDFIQMCADGASKHGKLSMVIQKQMDNAML